MPVALIAGASVVSAGIGAWGASKAADAQAEAAKNALDLQRSIYNNNQSNLQPFITAGQGATSTLSRLTGGNATPADYSSFYNSPDYKFAQEQGELGITRGANARGLNLSGGTLKDLATFNSGLASQQYGNYYNRLMQLATLGSNSASSLAGNNTNMASSMGNTMQGIGQAQASGIVGATNAITGSISNGVNNSVLANYVNPSAYKGSSSLFAGGTSPFNITGSLY